MAERGSIAGLRFVIACYRWFGRPIGLVLAHLIVLYYFLTIPRARRASRAYLRRIVRHPDGSANLGRPADTWASFLHFRAFAVSIVERIGLWLGPEGAFEFSTEGLDCYRRLLRPDRGCMVIGAHLGSFDALRALAVEDRVRVNVLMFTGNAPRINAVLRELSLDAELRIIESGGAPLDTVMRIRRCIENGEVVAILGDRIEPGDSGRSCRVSFLGDPVELPESPYLLAGALQCPLVFMVALRTGPRRYRVSAEVLSEEVRTLRSEREKNARELAAAYARCLERYCTKAPYQWFNFYDFWGDDA